VNFQYSISNAGADSVATITKMNNGSHIICIPTIAGKNNNKDLDK
jgi:hypothetical protein